jgi:hypothetical protein
MVSNTSIHLHMAWEINKWSCIPVASPLLHMVFHDHPDHIMRKTIIAIQVLDYATSVPDFLTSVATTQHTISSHLSSLQLSIKPTTQHEAYNSTQGLYLGMKPTTGHKAYNSTQRPTT